MTADAAQIAEWAWQGFVLALMACVPGLLYAAMSDSHEGFVHDMTRGYLGVAALAAFVAACVSIGWAAEWIVAAL